MTGSCTHECRIPLGGHSGGSPTVREAAEAGMSGCDGESL